MQLTSECVSCLGQILHRPLYNTFTKLVHRPHPLQCYHSHRVYVCTSDLLLDLFNDTILSHSLTDNVVHLLSGVSDIVTTVIHHRVE